MTASIICTIFLAAEVIGGLMSHSIAILSDASHVFADMSSFILSLIAIHFSSKNPTRNYNFGYSRLEVIIAVVNVIFIWALTAALVVEAIARVRQPDEFELNGKIMLFVSSLAVLFNLTLGLMLHGEHGHSHGGHTHSHGGGHSHAKSESQEDKHAKSRHSYHDDLEQADKNHAGDSGCASPASKRSAFSLSSIAESANNADINVRAAMIHVIGDLLQSIGVFIASVLIYVNPDWKIADPICTFLFSILVLCTTLPLLRDTLRILMMAAPGHIDHEKVSTALLEVKGVLMVHDLKIWTLSNSNVFCSCHLATGMDNHKLLIHK
ncbi:unnamed protein product [Oikopleura dioica]|uniref:Zinc transporter 8 n=1 Tax=Oikopleura dioica TaxID=34765 RepID=E4YJM9_OIKDI|nr:unnamed protein product [Oikopleura dioica]